MRILIVFFLALGLFGCGSQNDNTKNSSLTRSERPAVDEVPPLDRSKHLVPLDQIVFDTFTPGPNRALPLSEASRGRIQQLRDAIPPLHHPEYQEAEKAKWLKPSDMVIGYATGGESWAYPLKILNFHEIVNEKLGEHPVAITFCPLCYSGIVYSRIVDNRVLSFGNTSALYESSMVMFDYETGSYWWQVAGKAIVGELSGKELTVLPSTTTTFAEWKEQYPNTKVLSWFTGYMRDYNSANFDRIQDGLNQGHFVFPVSDTAKDARLPYGTKVLSVRIGNQIKAYPIDENSFQVINDKVADTPLVVFTKPQGPSGAVFERAHNDQTLTFELSQSTIRDQQTGSVWNWQGHAIDGPLKGEKLTPYPTKITFWFAIAAVEENLDLWRKE